MKQRKQNKRRVVIILNRAREILMYAYIYIESGTVCPREVRVNVYAVSLCCTAA
jgi:hypothetical protein